MKKLKNMKRLVFITLSLLCIISCTADFEKINKNPNFPESAEPSLLLPGIMREMASNWGGQGWEEGFTVTQYASRLQFTSGDRYDWSPTGNPYDDAYASLRDVENIIRSTKDKDDQQNYYGVALIFKSWIYSYLVDAYGDVPYTDATKGISDDNITPEFTPQSEVYDGIMADLKTANTILTGTENISGDILYGGDILKWRKFANSLRLRLAMRISDVNNAKAVAEMQEIIGGFSTYPIFESNADAALLQWNSDNPQPKYDTRSGSFDEVRLSTTLETRLKALGDRRLIVFAQPTSNSGKGIYSDNLDDYVGMPNGLDDDAALGYSPSGDPNESGSNFISRLGILLACRACNVEQASATASQTIIMDYSELQFILAEAREKGFISVGDASEYYENGIRASFAYYLERVIAGGWSDIVNDLQGFDVDAYIAQTAVGLTGTFNEKLEKIALQKWISLFYTGFEAWSDWRRTGIPVIIPGPDAVNGGKVPVRFQYPNSVKATNNANYQKAVSNMGADDLNTRLWWDIADND
ncbi:SusD/RagB family nutrient-binding outer membrane lipoprotein [Flavivirga spongiicola]|uniref:SusD/RagB family nutrient-binding outer membrane lipoprotein n=1 Tax=Flavivirga spongiicola TaxID=421621 RepID=A0ABU7XTA8_9FLAO|nr:SusD/RagB family nutrient-binding outer membrane lipoprotein [Flavivirga sp. MEBiC05379]MDO5979025.1 SusD/RagB family nutrient-binding outer membrane lipoprotein [Flavivirga sp. MEBiC05379]